MAGPKRSTQGRIVAGLCLVTAVLLATPGVASAATYSSSFRINPSLVLVSGIVMAVLCALIANSKGRSVALWAVLGFFFGLISLIIIALLKRQQPAWAPNTMSAPPPPPSFNPPPPAMPPIPPPDQTNP